MSTPTTVSICTPETEGGRHQFEIFGYSKHKGMGQAEDKFIRSGTFSVGVHDWSIRFYPEGYSAEEDDNLDCVSVFLELMSEGTKVHASCDLQLISHHTGMPVSVHKTEPRMFNLGDISIYAPQTGLFMERSDLESSMYLKDDHFTIECVVTVLNEPRDLDTKSRPRIQVPPSEIGEHLGKLLESGQGADVTFKVRGVTFTAHKSVLAVRSPVFKAEFCGPMKEATAQHLPIVGVKPIVFRALLQFIYTDSLPAFDDLEGGDRYEMIRHLLVAADRYAMDRLKVICQSMLCEELDVKNMAKTLAFADQYHCDMLKEACIEFISSSTLIADLKRKHSCVTVDPLVTTITSKKIKEE
ncbi:unnamed protein product [Urochloa decumbens]|uniref:Uncharacterized protein n=1 Tax=Urochloa decumbens TaxID=240449 RepID=A0ABC9BZ39_9POAL